MGMENRIDRVLLLPEAGTDFKEQLFDCLKQVEKYILWTGSRIVQRSFFINAPDNSIYLNYHQIILNELAKTGITPSTSIIAQAPASGYEVSVELILIHSLSDDMKIIYASEQGINYTILSSIKSKEIYVGGISTVKPFEPFVDQVDNAFILLESILQREGMFFSDITRQWNYVEGILAIHDIGENHIQNYQVLNDVRSNYYEKSNFNQGYPAATGIGVNSGGIVLEIYAIKSYDSLEIIPLKNPKQIDAYHYSEECLIGDALESKQKKTTPKFERAKFVGSKGSGTIYISGTASIHNERCIGVKDVKLQTKTTIDNISSLIDSSNLEKGGFVYDPSPSTYSFLRVYIKNKDDFQIVKGICDEYYGEIPIHYLIADICREDLLLEIEGVVVLD